MLTKQEALWEEAPGQRAGAEGTQVDCPATWLAVSGLMVMGLVSRSPLVNHSDSGPFLVAHTLLSQHGRQRGGFWEVVGHVMSPFDLS